MKKSIFLIALSIGMVACSNEAENHDDSPVESTQEGNDSKVKELERLSTQREALNSKYLNSLENGAVDEANGFKVQMDSVDAVYQELLMQ